MSSRPLQALSEAFMHDAQPHLEALRRLGWPVECKLERTSKGAWGTLEVSLVCSVPLPPVPFEAMLDEVCNVYR